MSSVAYRRPALQNMAMEHARTHLTAVAGNTSLATALARIASNVVFLALPVPLRLVLGRANTRQAAVQEGNSSPAIAQARLTMNAVLKPLLVLPL
jgi:hypothetical protein